jgi:hypothetical protein
MQKGWMGSWLACLCLQGCATGYGAAGPTGGYVESRVNARLIKVDFSGNGFIKSDKVQTYALYRCAEVARYAKKPYLVLYDSLTAAARDRPASLPRVGTLGGKPVAFAVMVLEDQPRIGSQDVAELLARLGPEVLGTRGDGKAAP